MHDCECRAEPELFLGKGKRREATDSISTEDDMPSRRAEERGMVTKLFDRRHEGAMMGALDTEFLDSWGSAPVPLAEIHLAPRSLPAG